MIKELCVLVWVNTEENKTIEVSRVYQEKDIDFEKAIDEVKMDYQNYKESN
jgi:hypothetical protein